MKIGKIILSIVAVLVVVIGLGTWYVLANLNSLVRDAVETVGSDTLATGVHLKDVDIRLAKGSGEMGRFSIDNYPGFKQSSFITVDKVKVDIDPGSLRKDVLVIEELTIQGVNILAEQLGSTTNLQSMLKHLPKSESGEGEKSGGDDAASEMLFAVKQLNFVDNSLTLATEKYGVHTLKLPKIEQRNLGSETHGLTSEQLAREIAKPLLASAKKSLEKGLKNIAEEALDKQLDKEKDKLKSKIDQEFGEGTSEKLKDLKKLF